MELLFHLLTHEVSQMSNLKKRNLSTLQILPAKSFLPFLASKIFRIFEQQD
ncbi:hypothetical protein S1OALGB6SA_1621 [Olavius algarvensis spirochete endosymbiont]|nr:MAG: hypothetical protein [Olavius algarvensis spirochete endosymbiont]VDB00539.1 hypothetical protein S1OALGB6SA_1621 [Olavius algarvensis spirochete endosymbiont]